MELFFAYLAGLLTLINPCIIPVLPIALVSTLNGHKYGPFALVAGLCAVFTTVGILVSSIGPSFGITEDTMGRVGAVLMIVFGIVMLTPSFLPRFSGAFAGMSDAANMKMNDLPTNGLGSQFLGGALLGLVWSPCIGPTLGGAIGLAASGGSLFAAGQIMFMFSLGVATVILTLAYLAKGFLTKNRDMIRSLASRSTTIIGVTFLLIGLLLFFNIHHMIDSFLLDIMPEWLADLSVRY